MNAQTFTPSAKADLLLEYLRKEGKNKNGEPEIQTPHGTYILSHVIDIDTRVRDSILADLSVLSTDLLSECSGVDAYRFNNKSDDLILQIIEESCGVDSFVAKAQKIKGNPYWLCMINHSIINLGNDMVAYRIY